MQKVTYHDVFSDRKLSMTLEAMADRYNEAARKFIYKTYTDPKINSIYRGYRASGEFAPGGKSKVHRESIRFPNSIVFDFVDKVMKSLYGDDWLQNNKALNHDLVKPWHIVDKL